MIERQPFLSRHLTPKKSIYGRIENTPEDLPKYMFVYVRNGNVYRRVFFNNFRYADVLYAAGTRALLDSKEPLWNINEHSMIDGITMSREEALPIWISRRTS